MKSGHGASSFPQAGPRGDRATLNPNRLGSTAAGLIVDGELMRLEGEPPVARSKGWGERPGR